MAAVRVMKSEDPRATAGRVLGDALRAVLDERGHVRLAIAGGSALSALAPAFEALGEERAAVRLTWVDERCVPVGDAASNRGAAHGSLGEQRPGEELPLWLDEESPAEALARVRAGLSARFDDQLDVTLLGMGGDGHIASLFVGRTVVDDRVAYIADSPKPPPERMTLTRALLASATTHVLLATGEGKRDALRRLVAGDLSLPAAGLDGLVLVTDIDLETTS